MTMMRNNFSSQEWLKFIGKEKLQTFQDSFARVDNISLCFFDLDGAPLTVWSNSSLLCHQIIQNNKKRCQQEKEKSMCFLKKTHQIKLFTCYLGLTYFMCPVYYNNKMIAIAYGGGIATETNNVSKEIIERYNIPVMAQRKLQRIGELLVQTMALVNFDLNAVEKNDLERNELETNIFHGILSKREAEVAMLICQGLTNKQIADKLFVSEKTIKTHVSNILSKLEIKDRMQLILEYCRIVPNDK